jgi:hypothetical protein
MYDDENDNDEYDHDDDEMENDQRIIEPLHPNSPSRILRRGENKRGRLKASLSFALAGMIVGSLLSTAFLSWYPLIIGAHRNNIITPAPAHSYYSQQEYQPPVYNTTYKDAPTFIFTMGVEGTGHHFQRALLTKSPAVATLRRTNASQYIGAIRIDFLRGLMMPYCSDRSTSSNPINLYRNLVESLEKAGALLKNRPISYFPINGNPTFIKGDGHEFSYPDDKRCNRNMYPDIAMLYKACNEARVNCGVLYLYRDPYAVIKSTTLSRKFNHNVAESIHLYTMMLQILYSQLSLAPEKTMACVGLYDDNEPDEDRWYPIRDMYGWNNDHAAFDRFLRSVYQPHEPMTQEDRDGLIPPEYRLHMEGFMNEHERVIDLCRRQVRARKNST